MTTEPIVIILALLQGLAEFLPISSSGHLTLAQNIFGITEPEVAFTIVLHLATLLAVVVFYRQTIAELACELKYLPCLFKGWNNLKRLYSGRPNFRFLCLICVASIPTGAIGLLLKDIFVELSASTLAVGLGLLFTGCVLKISSRKSGDEGRDISEMTATDALIIGLMQALAITPGISRSGMTISAALLRGLRRDLAAKFSFILSIPAIVGAMLVEILGGIETGFSLFEFALGFTVAAVSGYLALALLVFIINKNSFGKFAYYCWLMGLTAIVWSFL